MNGWALACLVGVGGSIGAVARYGVGRWTAKRGGKPRSATLAVNLAGSLALGALVGANADERSEAAFAFAGTGIMGGLTTYSTLNAQKAELTRERQGRQLAVYVFASYAGGMAAFAAGWLLGRALLRN
ncbi:MULTISPECIES: fluoride efflux transporter FluC [Cohnella]|uniref:fluoride efflux transporter FluC n=1 Tax=Cohnella TaxID=329857 RepID=UPI0009B98E6B|nr:MULTISPECIES: CrcB family protein [Cohnella]MBN2983441.1 CrcB family protein [Cohnella algarum]